MKNKKKKRKKKNWCPTGWAISNNYNLAILQYRNSKALVSVIQFTLPAIMTGSSLQQNSGAHNIIKLWLLQEVQGAYSVEMVINRYNY